VPVLTASGRGADIMVPMAIPTFGGMVALVLTLQVVPVLYCAWEEGQLRWKLKGVGRGR
jgi:Cu(I)/Ag(I) efflux system membrane protein CusA/SilA